MRLRTLTMMHDAAKVLEDKFGCGQMRPVSAEQMVKRLVDMPESERQKVLHSMDTLVRGLDSLEESVEVKLIRTEDEG